MWWSTSLWNTQFTHLVYHEPNHFLSPLKTSNEAVNLSTTTELNHRNSTVCERVINNQQRSFLHEHAHWDLIKSTWPVTATVVHSHRNQILHFESLLEIQMVAGTCERPSSSKRSKDLVIYRKWRLMRWTKLKRTVSQGCLTRTWLIVVVWC